MFFCGRWWGGFSRQGIISPPPRFAHASAWQTPDSDFEGFDGEHRPHSTGGARSTADKELALLEHRLSGQIKGATMVSRFFAVYFLFFRVAKKGGFPLRWWRFVFCPLCRLTTRLPLDGQPSRRTTVKTGIIVSPTNTTACFSRVCFPFGSRRRLILFTSRFITYWYYSLGGR